MEQIYDPSPDEAVYQSVRAALETARTKAAAAINDAMVSAYWEIGRQIVEAQGDRAEYGQHLMEYLSERLTAEFGKGFTERNLRAMRQLYLAYPIRHTLCAELSWSHYRLIIRIDDPVRRDFYVRSAVEERWTVRQLDRRSTRSTTNDFWPLAQKEKTRFDKRSRTSSRQLKPTASSKTLTYSTSSIWVATRTTWKRI